MFYGSDKEELHKIFMAGIRDRAPAGAWKVYEDTRSKIINESTWQNKNSKQREYGAKDEDMNQAQLEEVNNTFDNKLVNTMKAFKSIVDERLDGIENEITKAKTTNAGGGFSDRLNNPGHMQAFKAFVKNGDASGLREIQNAMSVGTSADGGYSVPTVIDTKISEIQLSLNPMRQVSDVVQITTPNFSRLANVRGTASGWVGETASRPSTNSLQFAPLVPFMGELYANPKATQQLLDDAGFDIESFIVKNIGEQFATAEGAAFTTGDGITKPKGFLAYPTAATLDGVRAFGTLQYIPTTAAADFAVANPADQLFQMVYSLKAAHRNGAVWMMSKAILDKIRRFKTTTGEYLWTDTTAGDGGIAGAAPGRLLGFPVFENEDMPTAVAANAFIAAFGNFKNGYCIVDRMGTRMIRDEYTDKPYVNFYTTKRVGGMLCDSEAIRLLKCAAA